MTASAHRPLVGKIDHLGLTVPDLEAAVAFYTNALGGRVAFRLGPFDSRELTEGDGDWTAEHVVVPDALYDIAMMAFGDGPLIEFFEYKRPVGRQEAPRNNDIGGHHIAFEVADLDAALAQVVAHGGIAQAGPIVVPAGDDASGSWPAFSVNYVQDPWGNQLELVYYPDNA
ncbi:MAG: VOC family protein [Microbacterium sp.]|nr:MAG: VOC family protein [Microbacterium sp.]